MAADDVLDNIRAEASRIEEDAIHSGKGHLEAATTWRRVHLWLGVPAAVASALSALSVLTTTPAVTVTLSVIAAILTSLVTFLKPDAKASAHAASGNRYLAIRARARVFRTIDLLTGDDPKALAGALTQLAETRDQLNDASEQIPPWAYKRAKEGIAVGEATHAADKLAKSGRRKSGAE